MCFHTFDSQGLMAVCLDRPVSLLAVEVMVCCYRSWLLSLGEASAELQSHRFQKLFSLVMSLASSVFFGLTKSSSFQSYLTIWQALLMKHTGSFSMPSLAF